MNIIKNSTILELPHTLEQGSAEIMCSKPYRIERIEEDNQITWFGYNTNWKRVGKQWYELVGADFEPCGIPEYEKIFITINNK